jgi:hypothetical protein
MTSPMPLYFYQDAGHGWVGATRDHLAMAGLAPTDLTACSYRTVDTYYLEQDVDAPAFVNALKAKGISLEWRIVEHGARSWIRDLRTV